MSTSASYLQLFSKIISCQCSEDNLKLLKTKFEPIIKSQRRLDHIVNLDQLIRILEKRDALSKDNVEVFKDIALVLNQQSLLTLIDQFGKVQHFSNNLHPICQQQILQVMIDATPKERAYDLISKEIGTHWKDFARALNIREGQIDDLEMHFPWTIRDRVLAILNYYDDAVEDKLWRSNLLNALSRAKRNDLSLSVQYILDTGCFRIQ